MTLEFSRQKPREAKIARQFIWDYVDLLWKAMNLMDPSLQEPRDVNHWPTWKSCTGQDGMCRTLSRGQGIAVKLDFRRTPPCVWSVGLQAWRLGKGRGMSATQSKSRG